jgi:malate synthase
VCEVDRTAQGEQAVDELTADHRQPAGIRLPGAVGERVPPLPGQPDHPHAERPEGVDELRARAERLRSLEREHQADPPTCLDLFQVFRGRDLEDSLRVLAQRLVEGGCERDRRTEGAVRHEIAFHVDRADLQAHAAGHEDGQPVLAERIRLVALAPPGDLEQEIDVRVRDPGALGQELGCSHMQGVETLAARDDRILTDEALSFVAELHREFNPERERLLAARQERMQRLTAGELPDFLTETASVRTDPDWRVAEAPADLQDRRVEITGPVDRKMVINALNSGASVFMADFEDANSPTWENCVTGQANLIDAVERTISLDIGEKSYSLNDEIATLLVRPRGWHLQEKHVLVDGHPVSASLFDFGLYMFHCAARLGGRGSGPYFYLPKLESHVEARLWNDAFVAAQERLGLPRGTIRATVLIETILAAFEMEEILYELREHSSGLNAGRWDYIFSMIKKFRDRDDFVLPDRGQVTMTVPFMRAYTQLLVRTCHGRGAHAIGGMAAFIPSRRDPEINAVALERVSEDKVREANDGFDGTWVAHPDLVPTAKAEFDRVLGERPNQLSKLRQDVSASAGDLLNVAATPGDVSEDGVRQNVSVGIRYIGSWLQGVGAAAINNLMEDAATAEISRSQIWQWVRHGRVGKGDVEQIVADELQQLGDAYGPAAELFQQVALDPDFVEFLTLPAYELLP